MKPTSFLLVVVAAVSPGVTLGQSALAYDHGTAAPGLRVGGPSDHNQVALEVGYVSAGLSFARRLEAAPLSVGVGVWGSWEPPGTFDKNVWEPIGFFLFGRFAPAEWLHVDVGPTAARYVWADDCSDWSGTFIGFRSALLIGHRFVHRTGTVGGRCQ